MGKEAMPGTNIQLLKITVLQISAVLLFLSSASAQESDSGSVKRGKPPLTRFTTESSLDYNNDSLYKQDTALSGFQVYHPLYRSRNFFQDLGNIGSPYRLFAAPPDWGFGLGFAMHDLYLLKPERSIYYNSRTPYTNLHYIQGVNEMSLLQATHSRNITPRWNMAINFSNTSSPGFQLQQKTRQTSTQLTNWYHTRNKRYHLLGNITLNRTDLTNNGGITDDELFEIATGVGRQFFVHLQDSRNRVRERTIYIKQYYRLGKIKSSLPVDSSIVSDSSNAPDSTLIPDYFANVAHSFRLHIIKNYHEDTDPASGYYRNVYSSSDTLRDSLKYYSYENEFSLFSGLAQKRSNLLRSHLFRASVTHQFFQVRSNIGGDLMNLKLQASLHNNPETGKALTYSFSGAYFITGYNGQDHQLQGSLGFRMKFFELKLSALNQQKEPDFILNYYNSNNFKWINNFNKTGTTSLTLDLKTRSFRNNATLSLSSMLVTNYIYFDTAATVRQFGGQLQLSSLRFSKLFRAGNFYLNTLVLYQQVSGGAVLRIPDLCMRHSGYYQHMVFNNAMLFQIGMDVTWWSSYAAYAYAPAIRQYYLQDELTTGNYPIADAFINGQIKRANFFFKMEHVNQGLNGRKSYVGPHYPIPYRSFILGVQWRFYD